MGWNLKTILARNSHILKVKKISYKKLDHEEANWEYLALLYASSTIPLKKLFLKTETHIIDEWERFFFEDLR